MTTTTPIEVSVNLTPRLERVLERGLEKAASVGLDNTIGVEHSFYAMLEDEGSMAFWVLTEAGVDVGDVLAKLDAVMSKPEYLQVSNRVVMPDGTILSPGDPGYPVFVDQGPREPRVKITLLRDYPGG